MRPTGRLRWKMLALMLVGTIVIYVDRNVLGVLAPILKKELNFTTELATGRGLSDRLDWTPDRLRRRRSDLGRGGGASRVGERMDLDGGFPRAARAQRSRRDPDGHEDVDRLVSLAGAFARPVGSIPAPR
jgi:hypothetical protein